MSTPARDVGEESAPATSGAGAERACPPADFVYDNGQIVLEPPHDRAEEERRRFVEGLRRLRGRAGDLSVKGG